MLALVETAIVTDTAVSQYPLSLLYNGSVPLTVAPLSDCATRAVMLPVYRQVPPIALVVTNCRFVNAAVPSGLPGLSPVIATLIGVPPSPAPLSQIGPAQPNIAALEIMPPAPSGAPASLTETALIPQVPVPSSGDVTLTLPVSAPEAYGSGTIAADDVPAASNAAAVTAAAVINEHLHFI